MPLNEKWSPRQELLLQRLFRSPAWKRVEGSVDCLQLYSKWSQVMSRQGER